MKHTTWHFWQVFLCLFLFLNCGSFRILSQEHPNIVVFIADDAGMAFGCYGYPGATTPHIDQLAEDGLLCKNAFLTAPQCSPSRSSMLAGQFAHTIGTEDLHTGINDTTRLLPSYLKEAGYFTGLMLKGHVGKHGMQQFDWYDQGFWPDYARDGIWNEKAVDNFASFLNEANNRPFFLWVGFVDPHRAYREDPVEGNRAPEINDPAKVTVPPYLVDAPATRQDLAHYYDEITRMDAHIGDMMEQLEAQNLLDNTLVIFLSDNGKPFPRAKGTLYDSGLHTPLIFSWKGKIKAGTTYQPLVSTIDLAPTLLDIAGIDTPKNMYGKSIAPIFSDQQLNGREYVFAERNWHGTDEHMRSIRSEEYLLVLNAYTHLPHGTPSEISQCPSWYDLKKGQTVGNLTTGQAWLFRTPRYQIELYDVKQDPHQLNNLSGNPKYLEISDKLTQELVTWMKETRDHPPHQRRRTDIVDRISGFSIKGDRKFFEGYWEE